MATIIDVDYDILAFIILLVVQSPDGPANLARIISVCKGINIFGDDKTILRSVVFDEEKITSNFKLFQMINGLLFKCAQAGNYFAWFLLSKVMLLSTSQLLTSFNMRSKPDSLVCSFLHWFMPKQARAISSSSQSFVHYDLAKFFLSQCTIYHLPDMRVHLHNYIDYFSGDYNSNTKVLHQAVTQMCSIAADLIELNNMKEDVEKCTRVVREEEMKANVRHDLDPVVSFWRYKAFSKANMQYTIAVVALKNKCREVNLNYDEYFGESANPAIFSIYVQDTIELFEVYRCNAILDFGLLTAFENEEDD